MSLNSDSTKTPPEVAFSQKKKYYSLPSDYI